MKKFIKICCLIVIVLFLLQLPVFGYVPFGEEISAYKLTKYADATGLTRENIGKVKTVFNSYFPVVHINPRTISDFRITFFPTGSMTKFPIRNLLKKQERILSALSKPCLMNLTSLKASPGTE